MKVKMLRKFTGKKFNFYMHAHWVQTKTVFSSPTVPIAFKLGQFSILGTKERN